MTAHRWSWWTTRGVGVALSLMVAFSFGGCGPGPSQAADASTDDDPDPAPSADASPPETPRSAERTWLDGIGRGPAQTRRVCARGHADPVARALCAEPAPAFDGLPSLYAAVGLHPDEHLGGRVALGASSSGLSFRTVSPLNPRVFLSSVSEGGQGAPVLDLVVAAFTRGEPQVELVGYDKGRDRLNFYLLTFEPSCAEAACTPEELLGPAIERSWRPSAWTLYEADDLVDTGLDCLSCHQPAGAGPGRRLLMRDLPDPWFHWFPPVTDPMPCGEKPEQRPFVDYRQTFERAHKAHGSYGGLPLAALANASGHDLHTTVLVFGRARNKEVLALEEPFVMPAEDVVRQWRCEGRTDAWQAYRKAVLLERGLPIPTHQFERLDGGRSASARDDYLAFLRARASDDAFDVAANLLRDDVQVATGARADDALDGATLLASMCLRCHDERAPQGSRRARFRVDQLTPASIREALARIALPPRSAYLMPPRRAGALSDVARDRLRAYLEARSR